MKRRMQKKSKRGRPLKGGDGPAKYKQIVFKLTEAQYQAFKKAANGTNIASYVRDTLLKLQNNERLISDIPARSKRRPVKDE